jgi:hypothetical protein
MRRFAGGVSHTGSDNEDGSLLTLFDLSERRIISQWQPESHPASEHDFDRASRSCFFFMPEGHTRTIRIPDGRIRLGRIP